MRTMIIIFRPPLLYNNLCLLHRIKHLAIQNLITQFAVERLNVAVLPRTARFNIQRSDMVVLKPLFDLISDKLRPVGTPVALRAPSVPTAVTDGDEFTLKQPVFCLDNG